MRSRLGQDAPVRGDRFEAADGLDQRPGGTDLDLVGLPCRVEERQVAEQVEELLPHPQLGELPGEFVDRPRRQLFGLKPGDQPVAGLDFRFGGIAGRRLAVRVPAEPRVVLILLGLPLQIMPLHGPTDAHVVEIVAAIAAVQVGSSCRNSG